MPLLMEIIKQNKDDNSWQALNAYLSCTMQGSCPFSGISFCTCQPASTEPEASPSGTMIKDIDWHGALICKEGARLFPLRICEIVQTRLYTSETKQHKLASDRTFGSVQEPMKRHELTWWPLETELVLVAWKGLYNNGMDSYWTCTIN